MNKTKLSLPIPFPWILERLRVFEELFAVTRDFEIEHAGIREDRGRLCAFIWLLGNTVLVVLQYARLSMKWSAVMIQNYLIITFRNIRRHKGFSFINIASLAIGMVCCLLIFLWVQDELSYDRFHENARSIHRVAVNDPGFDFTWPMTSIPVGPALKQGFPEILEAARVSDMKGLISREQINFDEIGAFVDPSFLQMFSFPLSIGNPRTVLRDPSSVVLSEKLAGKFFGEDSPLGRTIRLNDDLDLTVTGVFRDMPRNSLFVLDFLAPFEIYEERDREPGNFGRFQIYTYVRVQDKTSNRELGAKVAGFLQEHGVREGPVLEPLTDIHLRAVDGGGDIRNVYIFSLVAVFVLAIACINFMNLATAKSSIRLKEIGLRKVAGAQKKDLVRQFLGESILISWIALMFALLLAAVSLPAINRLTDKQMTLNPGGNGGLVLGLIGIALVSGFLAGSYPALVFSAFKPVNILRGSLSSARGGKTKTSFRKALVVFQFSVSVFLVISTLVVLKQLRFIQQKNLGFNKNHVISVPLRGSAARQVEALKGELIRNPRIILAAASSELPLRISRVNTGYDWEGKNPKEESRMTRVYVDNDFIATMGMTILQGRGFSRDHPRDSSESFIVNESAVKAMSLESPIGKRFSAPLQSGMRDGTIVGVVKDFHFKPLHDEIEPLVMFIMPDGFNYLLINVQSDISDLPGTIRFIEGVWGRFAPNFPFEYSFLDDIFDRFYKSEQKTGRIFGYFAFMAVFVSCMGLFGLSVQISEQRTKEIGIRKVLGARVSEITLHLSRDYMCWIMLANLISWPAAYLAMSKWLQNFAYRTSLGIGVFVIAAGLAFLIAFTVVGFQSIKAALANPVDSLRCE